MAEGTKVPSNGDRDHSLKNGHCKATENDKVETILICMIQRNFEEKKIQLESTKKFDLS